MEFESAVAAVISIVVPVSLTLYWLRSNAIGWTLWLLRRRGLGNTSSGSGVTLSWQTTDVGFGNQRDEIFHIQVRARLRDYPRSLSLCSPGATRYKTLTGEWRVSPPRPARLFEEVTPVTQEARAVWNAALVGQLPERARVLIAERSIWIDRDGVTALLSARTGDSSSVLRAQLVDTVAAVRELAALLAEVDVSSPAWSFGALPSLSPRERALLLRHLCSAFRGHPRTKELCRQRLERGERAEKVAAALHLGDEALLEVPALLNEEEVPAQLWLDALVALGTKLEAEDMIPLYQSALRISDGELRRVAMRRLLSSGVALEREAIEELAFESKDTSLLLDLVRVLPEPGSAWWEVRLLSILRRRSELGQGRDRLLDAILGALERDGTAAAISTLRRCAAESWLSRPLQSAAGRAIERIQERLGEVASGALAVAEGEEGGGSLSLASEGGALMMAEEGEEAEADEDDCQTTDHGRRTTDDGRRTTDDG